MIFASRFDETPSKKLCDALNAYYEGRDEVNEPHASDPNEAPTKKRKTVNVHEALTEVPSIVDPGERVLVGTKQKFPNAYVVFKAVFERPPPAVLRCPMECGRTFDTRQMFDGHFDFACATGKCATDQRVISVDGIPGFPIYGPSILMLNRLSETVEKLRGKIALLDPTRVAMHFSMGSRQRSYNFKAETTMEKDAIEKVLFRKSSDGRIRPQDAFWRFVAIKLDWLAGIIKKPAMVLPDRPDMYPEFLTMPYLKRYETWPQECREFVESWRIKQNVTDVATQQVALPNVCRSPIVYKPGAI